MDLASPTWGRNLAALTCSLSAGAPCLFRQEKRVIVVTIIMIVTRRCLWDQKPRSFDSDRVATLCNFSELLAREMEKTAVQAWKQTIAGALRRGLDCYQQAYLFVDVSAPRWRVMHVNPAFSSRTGG